MPTVVENIAFDCADPYELARFWSKVMRLPLSDDDHPGDPEAVIVVPNGANLFFQRVPEPKTVKNRVHVCLSPDTTRDEELARVLGLGATVVDDHRNADGTGFVVCADPEGNEFCVLRSRAQRSATHAGG